MRVAVFSSKPYDRQFLDAANAGRHELVYLEPRLQAETALLARDTEAVCLFVHDHADAASIATLAEVGVRVIALRCAGFNNVDVAAATQRGLPVARVPAYSPHGVAEHTAALLLTLNRRVHRAYHRVREGNFALDGLLGFDLHGKTVGVIGTGRIGACFAAIMSGFGCRILAYDLIAHPDVTARGGRYCTLEELFSTADIISLHCPLTPQTHRLINADAIAGMRRGVFLLNTGRGLLIDTLAVINGLKSGHIGALGIDVYEEEEGVFYEDLSNRILTDDHLARLLTFPNVLVTSHQAYFTQEAMEAIARTTIQNLDDLAAGRPCPNLVPAPES